MANSKYTQVTEMLTQGRLNWPSDSILAVLVKGASFNAGHKVLTDLGTASVAVAPIQGRLVATEGQCAGQPALFSRVGADQDYQLVVVQNVNNNNPNLLAWYDTNEEGAAIRLENAGTLVVRPAALDPIPEGAPATTRVWIKV